MENLVFLATEHSSHQCFNLGNMAINIVAVLILLVLLKKFAWDKLIDMLDERQKLVEGQLDDAAKNQKEALVLLEENQEKLRNAQKEIKVMMEDAREQSKVEEINKQIADLSVLVASKILERELDGSTQSEYVDKVIKEVGVK